MEYEQTNGQTDEHWAIAYTAIAYRRAVKNSPTVVRTQIGYTAIMLNIAFDIRNGDKSAVTAVFITVCQVLSNS